MSEYGKAQALTKVCPRCGKKDTTVHTGSNDMGDPFGSRYVHWEEYRCLSCHSTWEDDREEQGQ